MKKEGKFPYRLKKHMDEPRELLDILNDMAVPSRKLEVKDYPATFSLLIEAMQKYAGDPFFLTNITAALSSCIYQNIDTGAENDLAMDVILRTMEANTKEKAIQKSCFYVLHNMVWFYDRSFERIARLFSALVANIHDIDIERSVLELLSEVAYRYDPDWQLSKTGAIQATLQVMERRYSSDMIDDAIYSALSFITYTTDMIPENTKNFLESGLLPLLKKCYLRHRKHEGARRLQGNILNVIQHVVEAEELRGWLMNDEWIETICALSTPKAVYDEVNFQSAFILVQLIVGENEGWSKLAVSRDRAIELLEKTIDETKVLKDALIPFLVPLLRFIAMPELPAIQHWAVWNLASLTVFHKDQCSRGVYHRESRTTHNIYCQYVYDARGILLLRSLKNDARSSDAVKSLASSAIDNVMAWKRM